MTKIATSSMKKHFFITAAFTVIGLFIAVFLYLSLVPIELTGYRARIESTIKEKFGHTITFKKVVLKALPHPEIRLNEVRLLDDGETVLKARTLHIKLSALDLLAGRTSVRDLSVNGAELAVKRSPEGSINLLEYIEGRTGKSKRRIMAKNITISGSRVIFTDEVPAEKATFVITGLKAVVGKSPKGLVIDAWGELEPGARINLSGEVGLEKNTFDCGVSVTDMPLSVFGPYLRVRDPKASIEGIITADIGINISEGVSAKGRISYADLTANYPGLLTSPLISGSGAIKLELLNNAERNELRFTDLNLALDEFSISGSAFLTGPAGAKSIEASLSTTVAPIRALKELIPVKALPYKISSMADSFRPTGGNVTIKDLHIRSPLSNIMSGEALKASGAVSGTVSFDNLSFRHRALDALFSEIKGMVTVNDGTVTIEGLSGRYGHGRLKNLSGSLSDLKGNGRYDFTLDGTFEAGETLGALKGLIKEGPRAEKLSKAWASGTLGLKLRAKGSMREKLPADFSGEASFESVAVNLESSPMAVQIMEGVMGFDSEKVTFTGLSVSDGHSDIRLDGSVSHFLRLLESKSWEKTGPSFDISIDGVVAMETVSAAAVLAGKEAITSGLYLDEKALFKVSAKGNRRTFSLGTSIDLTPCQINFKGFVKKGKKYPLRLVASLAVDPKMVYVEKAEAGFGDSMMVLRGDFHRDLSNFIFAMGSDKVLLSDLDDISPLFKGEFDTKGLVRFNITGLRELNRTPSYEGTVELTGGRFSSPLIAKPVEEVNAKAEFTGNTALVEIDGMKAGTSSIHGRIEVLDINRKEVSFQLLAPRFDTADVFIKKDKKALAAGPPPRKVFTGSRAKKRFTGTGKIIIKEGRLWKHRTENFFAEVTLTNETINLHPVTAVVDNGTVRGEIIIFRDPKTDLKWKITAELSEVELEDFFDGLGAKKKILTGPTNGSVTIDCKRWAWPPKSCTNGFMSLASPKGKLYEFGALSKIFSIVNIFSVDELFRKGLQFKRLSGDFKFTDGVLSSDNLFLDSDSMRMSVVGNVNIVDKTTDSVLAMHPFVTIDKIITSIPLVGWVLTGEEQSMVSLYFKLTGPIKEPYIDPLPIDKMGNKIFSIFERLLELPMDMMKPGVDNKAP